MANMRTHPTLGVELEMPVVDLASGASFDGRELFPRLFESRRGRHEAVTPVLASGSLIGVAGPQVVSSVDNGFNNLESAIGIVGGPARPGSNLNDLAGLVHRELTELVGALSELGAGIANLSQHPATPIDEAFYQAMRAPKPIYDYWRDVRGWRHETGMDAKAQNGPTTGVDAEHAVEALNLALLAAPAMIALFANSPFEAGEPTGCKENRLRIWTRMFAAPTFPGDRATHRPPVQPFEDLAHYLRWMFEGNRAMQALPLGANSYKGFGELARMDGDPSLFAFLRAQSWSGRRLSDGAAIEVTPDLRHLESLQFSQFSDARIRFSFGTAPTVEDFFQALAERKVEALFADHCQSLYIEGRAAGANFPDAELCDLDDPLVSASVAMAPSAIQKGLQCNPGSLHRLSRQLPWRDLGLAREEAVRHGLDGRAGLVSLARFARAVVEEAEEGLCPSERWMLAYPLHVLETGRNGADRALAAFERGSGSRATRLRELVTSRLLRRVPPVPFPQRERMFEAPEFATASVA
ncbi:glutamate-cysteine ligase family protein [Aureimonas sp. AU20]|uniref:glutamate-cysteine ligase family protein n=1 Tax=Aureimonas sp. AU20 TaxID=1349819 RepID=UPI000B33CA9B|nr:glutamate-cysteine ligase family protein [Aureimonas sp. AU20]